MSTEPKQPGKGRWLMPLIIALPLLAGFLAAAIYFGPTLIRVINVAIKTVVMS